MRQKILIFVIILSAMPLFSQTDHIKKFFEFGMPRLDDYKFFPYDTIKSENSQELKKSENYNKYEIPGRHIVRMMFMRTSAYLVIKDSEILYEKYWFKYNKNSVMNSFSVSKSIIALLIGIAIDEEKINNLNQPVSDFLPEFTDNSKYTLRIKHLLSMSSGLSWQEDFANPMSDIVIAYYGSNIDSLIKKTKIIEEPGKKWKYQCGNTLILSLILEKATGMPVHKYAQKRLWTPLGACKDAYWGKDRKDGITKSFCCFYATPRDFAKIGLLVLNKGKYKGKQIISEKYIDSLLQPANWLKYKNKNVDFYGLHFWIVEHKNQKIPYFAGMFGQYIFIIPEQNAVVVRFGEMINELTILPVAPDVPFYLKISTKLLNKF